MRYILAFLLLVMASQAQALNCKGQSLLVENGVQRCVPLTQADIDQRKKDPALVAEENKPRVSPLQQQIDALTLEIERLKKAK